MDSSGKPLKRMGALPAAKVVAVGPHEPDIMDDMVIQHLIKNTKAVKVYLII